MKLKIVKTMKGALLALCLVIFAVNAIATPNITESVTGMEVSDETIVKGSELFSANCASCHQLEGKLVGPALLGMVDKYEGDYEWIFSWIKNNNKLIKAKDPRAIAIYEEYGKAAMTVFENLSTEEINSIIMYVENGGIEAPKDDTAGTVTAVEPPSDSMMNKINWMLLLMFVLVGVVIVMILKLIDLVSELTGRELIKWNNLNGLLMLVFLVLGLIAAFWEVSIHGKYALLWDAASEHGAALDKMMIITFWVTGIVFVITQVLLFWFSWKYRYKEGTRAYYYPHNNKLEYVWTIVPAIVLTVLVFGGLKVWRGINKAPGENVKQVELFAFQFGWQARYPGTDGELGFVNYNLISGSNPLGVANAEEAKSLIGELKQEIADVETYINDLPVELGKLEATLGGLVDDARKGHLRKIENIKSGAAESKYLLDIRRKNTQIERIESSLNSENEAYADIYSGNGDDDIIVKELHLIKGEPVTLKFRGRDVIHSAYMPEFRSQMNVVPGLPTQFTFTPTISTAEMREKKNNPDFDYHVVCNKICGNAHFNMKLKIVVEDETAYNEWLASQKGIFAKNESETEDVDAESNTETTEEVVAIKY